MIALTVRHDQDAAGAAIVIAGFVVLCLAAYLLHVYDQWRQQRRDAAFEATLASLPVIVLPLIRDHAVCVHEGCNRVLCFCPGLTAQGEPVTCPGAQAPACFHSLVSRATTGGHCRAHRPECPDCVVEAGSMWGGIR